MNNGEDYTLGVSILPHNYKWGGNQTELTIQNMRLYKFWCYNYDV